MFPDQSAAILAVLVRIAEAIESQASAAGRLEDALRNAVSAVSR